MKFKARFLWKFLMILVALAALGGVVMVLWNLVMPGLFAGTGSIDYWHALGLLVLSRILFGGFFGHHARHGRQHWDRWAAMTPEEREQFYKGRWGHRGGRHGHHNHGDQRNMDESV